MADTFKTASDLRWKIALLVSAAVAISYLDRKPSRFEVIE